MKRMLQFVSFWRTMPVMLAIVTCSTVIGFAEEIVISVPGEVSSQQKSPQKEFTLRIDDVKGTYTIPYIQSGRELHVRVAFTEPESVGVDVSLLLGEKILARRRVTSKNPSISFPGLDPGDYTLECKGLDHDRQVRSCTRYERIGIGTIIAALGDSITEGYYSHGFMKKDLNLWADLFPKSSVSRDGRNYPQFAPTTYCHMPSVNCFESWMTSLNNSLSATWQQPVFVANEGWGGITSGRYFELMRNDTNWQKRMRRLQPRVWLIHLGVNDERAHVKAADLRRNLSAMVDILVKDYKAEPGQIIVAFPFYDYATGAAEILQTYIAQIESLIKERGLGRGPDFFAAYAKDQSKWYGKDPVHPNLQGMERMARLWHEAIVRQLPSGPRD